MTIEIIPSGSSAVVTDNNYARDAERVKDTLAVMAATESVQFANIERSVANHFENTIQDVKDAESRLMKDAGDKFINIIQDVKDAETRLNSAAADRFIQTIQDVKDAAKDTALAAAHTNEHVQRAEVELAREAGRTREVVVCNARDAEKVAYQNQLSTMLAFKDQAMLSEKLAASQALLSEKLAFQTSREIAQSAKEAAECCCELKREVASVKDALKQGEIDRLREQLTEAKLLGRRFRTFSPVPVGTLQASDED